MPPKLKAPLAELKQAQVSTLPLLLLWLCVAIARTACSAMCTSQSASQTPHHMSVGICASYVPKQLCNASEDSSNCNPTCQICHEVAAASATQVKCVSFLTWLLRGYPAAIIAHRVSVTDALVHLLRTAPDVVAIRKELLVAMRNTLTLQQVRE